MVARLAASPTVTAESGFSAVTVRLFAGAAESAGVRTCVIGAENGMAVEDAFRRLCQLHPSLHRYSGRVMFAVNRDYAGPGALVHPGDELSVIPPVSGGANP